MFKKIAILLILVFAFSSLSGCGKKSSPTDNPSIPNSDNNNSDVVKDQDTSSKPKEDIEDFKGPFNPLTGLMIQEEALNNLPLALMINNHGYARPQVGLDQAEVVIEIAAEGGITRFLAIFLEKHPELVGPIRSARSYYIDKAMEFNSIFLHAGGSDEALNDIPKLKVKNLDAMRIGGEVYFRRSDRGVPYEHTLYTNLVAARNLANTRGFTGTSQNLSPFLFSSKEFTPEGDIALKLNLSYGNEYTVAYEYDESNKKYIRYIKDKPHADEFTQKQITTTNIIIQWANTKVIDNVGRLKIDLVSKGKGQYITQGKMIDITWEKTSREGKTYYYGPDGEELMINRGNTWIQVMPQYGELKLGGRSSS